MLNAVMCRPSYGYHSDITGMLIKSLAQPGRKRATATEDFDVHISYL